MYKLLLSDRYSGMPFEHAYVLPLIVIFWFPTTFIITYIISALLRNVNPLFPLISDTGSFVPESCIFGQLLNMGAVIVLAVVYIRYRQVREVKEMCDFSERIQKVNRISFIFGCITVVGISIVANVQQSAIHVVHSIGASAAFSFHTLYMILQVYMSHKMYPKIGSKKINVMRGICSVICIVCSLCFMICAKIGYSYFTGTDVTKWSLEDGGYDYHIVSAIAEWILAFTTAFYYLLYVQEFKAITFSEPPITLKLADVS